MSSKSKPVQGKPDQLSELLAIDRMSKNEKVTRLAELQRKNAQLEQRIAATNNESRQLKRALVDAEGQLSQFAATQGKIRSVKLPRGKKKAGISPATAIISCNDWHVEEEVDSDVVSGANKFNLSIADARISQIWPKACLFTDLMRSVSDINSIVLWLGGDLISGYIHPELEEGNQLGPSEAILFVQERLLTGINYLLAELKPVRLLVVCNSGNHARITPKRRISTGYKSSLEWIAYNNLALMFTKHKVVKFQIAKGSHTYVDIQGHNVRFTHGDDIKYYGGIGGVHIPLRRKIAQWDKVGRRADLTMLGHFHTFGDDWNYVLCGALIGYSAYAQSIGAEFQPPTQTFTLVNQQYGKIMALPLFVE